jgi:hypothetical protein
MYIASTKRVIATGPTSTNRISSKNGRFVPSETRSRSRPSCPLAAVLEPESRWGSAAAPGRARQSTPPPYFRALAIASLALRSSAVGSSPGKPAIEPSVLSFAIGRSCGASARACSRGVLSRRGPRRAPHHGLATVSDRGEDAMPDRRDPHRLAQSRPRDGPCGTSALGRVPPRPPLPLSGSGCRTRSHLDPDRDPRP